MAHLPLRALDVTIRGRVQGVGFRHSAQLVADRLGVAGWVRNLPDGTVEAHIEGIPDAVAAMVAWLRSGPPGAEVEGVATRDSGVEGHSRFLIRR